jgi:protein SCO1/2
MQSIINRTTAVRQLLVRSSRPIAAQYGPLRTTQRSFHTRFIMQQQQQQQKEQQQQQQQQNEQQHEEEEEEEPVKKPSFFRLRNIIFPVTAGALLLTFYFYDPRQQFREKQIAERHEKQKAVANKGQAQIGGSFTLVDNKGRPVTDSEFRGKWMLIYFGFTHCPDICPEEMRKMTRALHALEKKNKALADQIVPVFVTCDPNRDSVQAVDLYLKEGFHERFVGLTGTPDQIKRACQRYRVYYSAPDYEEGKEDYLVDHSIFFYLMDPYGHFKEYFPKQTSAEDVTERLEEIISNFDESD